MEKNTIMVVALAILVLVAMVQAIQISNIKSSITGNALAITGNAVAGSSGSLDTTGWTADEKMNYEMHGAIPARFQGQAVRSTATQSAAMVGGC